jgi:hypothetical protein
MPYDPLDLPPLATPEDLAALEAKLSAQITAEAKARGDGDIALAARIDSLTARVQALEIVPAPGPGPGPTPTPTPSPQPPPWVTGGATWKLTWADEFDAGLANWNVADKSNYGSSNKTDEVFMKENVVVENGILRLIAKREHTTIVKNPDTGTNDYWFTCGLATTRAAWGPMKYKETGGYWEARIRCPKKFVNGRPVRMLDATDPNNIQLRRFTSAADVAAGKWTTEATMSPAGTGGNNMISPNAAQPLSKVFAYPHSIILSMSIGGGAPRSNGYTGYDTAIGYTDGNLVGTFPCSMDIDYVRVWKP